MANYIIIKDAFKHLYVKVKSLQETEGIYEISYMINNEPIELNLDKGYYDFLQENEKLEFYFKMPNSSVVITKKN